MRISNLPTSISAEEIPPSESSEQASAERLKACPTPTTFSARVRDSLPFSGIDIAVIFEMASAKRSTNMRRKIITESVVTAFFPRNPSSDKRSPKTDKSIAPPQILRIIASASLTLLRCKKATDHNPKTSFSVPSRTPIFSAKIMSIKTTPRRETIADCSSLPALLIRLQTNVITIATPHTFSISSTSISISFPFNFFKS